MKVTVKNASTFAMFCMVTMAQEISGEDLGLHNLKHFTIRERMLKLKAYGPFPASSAPEVSIEATFLDGTTAEFVGCIAGPAGDAMIATLRIKLPGAGIESRHAMFTRGKARPNGKLVVG